MAWVAIEDLRKTYDDGTPAVRGVDLAVRDGEFVTILGPSGSGKTTLLRLVAGLERPTSGKISLGDLDVTTLPPRQRDVAMVFQDAALYPHLNVRDNLAFGLRVRRVERAEIVARVDAVAASLGLTMLLDRSPETLSGGQRQRVALGRAMVRRPAVFLLDEPLTGLDGPLRAAVRADLMTLHREHGATILHVTHDQAEALAMSDRVGVMDGGKLVQVGRPRDVYEHPACRFVAGFVGHPPMNLLSVEVLPGDGPLRVTLDGLGPELSLPVPDGPATPLLAARRDAPVLLGLRPERVALARLTDSPRPGYTWVPAGAAIRWTEFQGGDAVVAFTIGVHQLNARLPASLTVKPADRFVVGFDLRDACWFDPETGKSLAAIAARAASG